MSRNHVKYLAFWFVPNCEVTSFWVCAKLRRNKAFGMCKMVK